MKKLLLAACLLLLCLCGVLPLCAQHATFLVDLGSQWSTTANPDANGNHWNNVTDGNVGKPISSLITTAGQSSGISLSVSGFSVGPSRSGTTVTDSSTLGSLAIASATNDSFHVSGNDVLTVTLGNLSAIGRYRITLFGSHDTTETRITRYDVKGADAAAGSLITSGFGIGLSPQAHANRSNSVLFDQVAPQSDGTIKIEVRREGLVAGYLGALRLEVINPINFPPAVVTASIAGSPRVGTTLKANFLYTDYENDPLGTAQYCWEKASNTAVAQASTIKEWSISPECTLSQSEQGFFYRCAIKIVPARGQQSEKIFYTPWYGRVQPTNFHTIYHIGNSFTRWTNIPRQLEFLSSNEPRPTMAGRQLADGQALYYHWNAGVSGGFGITEGTLSREELATGSWDTLILQPHSTEWMSSGWILSFTDFARRFSQLAQANNTQVYLYAYWPWQTLSISDQLTINNVFEQVRSSISTNLSRPVMVIPAGQALRAVVDACGTGELATYNRSSFYVDERHQSALGGYVTALTHYSTVYRKSPVGLPSSTLSPWADNFTVSIPPAVAARIQQIVWEVVQSYPHSGLGVTSFPTNPVPPPLVIPPPAVEPDPPFVTESTTPSDSVLLAYAFGAGSSGSEPVLANYPRPVAATAGTFATEYTVNPTAESEGVIYTPHWSYDLKNWTLTQPTNTTISRTNNTVRISWPTSSRWRFLRIHVAKPEQ